MLSKYRVSLLVGFVAAISAISTFAADIKIAVTDLTYEEKVSQYFRTVSATSKTSVKESSNVRDTDKTYSERNSFQGKQESSYNESEGYYTYIDRGELRSYTADLKGAILKGSSLHLTQARPYPNKDMEKIYDVIGRIKQGLYPGADYVLFGTLSSIEFNQDSMSLGNTAAASLSLDLVADFSLINTKTYEVKAAFSASGSGKDTKLMSSAADRISFNRGKVISQTSKSLAQTAYVELMTQLDLPIVESSTGERTVKTHPEEAKKSPVKVF